MKKISDKEKSELLVSIFRTSIILPFFGNAKKPTDKSENEFVLNGIKTTIQPTLLKEQNENVCFGLSLQVDVHLIKFLRSITSATLVAFDNLGTWNQLKAVAPHNYQHIDLEDKSETEIVRTIEEPVYVGLVGSNKILFELKRRTLFQYPSQYLRRGDIFYNGEIGIFGNIRIVKYSDDQQHDEIIVLGNACSHIGEPLNTSCFSVNNDEIVWNPYYKLCADPKQIKRFIIK